MQSAPLNFGPHCDLTYRVIEDITLDETDLRQCLFTGAVFRRTVFQKVNFRRSDFDAARFEACRFVECDLSIDMRSALFVNTEFIACKLGTAFITDCSFDACTFERIHFDDCAISHNQFIACRFTESSLTQSTFVHNTVRRCEFFTTNMGDCTFLYVVMKDCLFFNCAMNVESVGMIYGLTESDVQHFRYVHLGVDQSIPEQNELVLSLVQQYVERRWRIGVAVMRLTFRLAAPLFTFHQYLTETHEVFLEGTPLNREEMLFVAKLMDELAAESRLPLATCFDVSRWCAAAMDLTSQMQITDSQRTADVLRELSTRALKLSQDGLRSIEHSDVGRLLSGASDEPAIVQLAFVTRPTIDIPSLMTQLPTEAGLAIMRPSVHLRGHLGSWVEYVQTTVVSLAALRVFLYFINGVLYDMTEARARATMLTRSRLPKEFLDVALRPQAPISASLVSPLKKLAGEALQAAWLNDPHLGGLDAPNIKTVQMIDGSESHTNDEVPR